MDIIILDFEVACNAEKHRNCQWIDAP